MTIYVDIYAHFSSKIFEIFKIDIYDHFVEQCFFTFSNTKKIVTPFFSRPSGTIFTKNNLFDVHFNSSPSFFAKDEKFSNIA